jgi:multidrug efflux pump subunit AcrA (membrane-fusion protein)
MPSAACRDEAAVLKPSWIVLIGAAALSAACGSSPGHEPDERAVAPTVTAAAEMADLASSIEAGGIIRARVTALVASRVMAPIIDVHVRAGDRVQRGDVLVTLDGRDLRANDARAQAATLSAAESVRAAEADVRATESAAQLARLTHDRIVTLHAKRSATTEELDQAVATLSTADAQHAAAQARLAAATAGRDAAKAAADAAAVTATFATLTAPFGGIVAERNAEAGSMATPGSPLLTLEDPTTYRLECRLDDTRAAQVTPGRAATIQLDDREASMTGRVVEIARVDPMSHTFLVKLDLPAGVTVRSGQFGRATFAGPSRRALTIPLSALARRGQLTFVFVRGSDGRAHLQPVSIGAVSGDRVEVLAGVRQGDRVVTSPEPSLADGNAIARTRP